MILNDLQLLARYHLEGDATAFRNLVQAHAAMVFTTARRITRDQAMAEDVAQETFLQLARQSRNITQSVAAWLHRVAWRQACNAVRDDATRRRIEEEAAVSKAAVGESTEREATWTEVERALDEAIDALPEELRAPLVMHFLQGRRQREIAEQMGVSQSTISRQIDDGLSVLRNQLKTRGLLCGGGLSALLLANHATSAPASLLASMTKLSMSGIGTAKVATVPTSASTTAWVKAGLATLLTTGGALIITRSPTSSPNPNTAILAQSATPINAPSVALPLVPLIERPLATKRVIASIPTTVLNDKPMPVHELVHSFPTPPKIPAGHLAQDDEGWLWGTTSSGGRYGKGTVYRMTADGLTWEEMVSFNGREGLPKGGYPHNGVTRAPDGRFWGMTGSSSDPATIFCFDPRSVKLSTEIVFEPGEVAEGCPTILHDGQIGFSTRSGVFTYDPATKKRTLVWHRASEPSTALPIKGELVPDGHGWLWATSSGGKGHGSVSKLNLATGENVVVLAFTGKTGALPGSNPSCGLTLDSDGFLWGCTRNGGAADQGTVFKIHAETGAFTSVSHFQMRDGISPGANPESMLADDGRGYMWGTTSYGGRGQGTIYKVERTTGKLTVVMTFTGIDGTAPGGIARGHLLRAGPDHFVGACSFWGAGWSGVIYRVDIPTGHYAVLKDLAELATNNEGVEPHGSLAETSDGMLWGTTFFNGAHHCGTIYKVDSISQKLVSVVDFTGKQGSHPGRNPDAGLVSDGLGWLWGTTRMGGRADAGTIFKLNEQTGAFISVAEFGTDEKMLPGVAPMTEMVLDERGQLWGTTSNSVFKVDPRTHEVKNIIVFGGDEREPFGSEYVGKLAVDGKGFVWGCTLADRTHKKASLFKISTADNVFHTVEIFPNAQSGWSGWHPAAQMYRDTSGSLWFTGVLEQRGSIPHCTLNRLDPLTGRVSASHSARGFSIIDTPVEDGHGRLWGTIAMNGLEGELYTFDVAAGTFQRALEFTGHGSQARAGSQPMFGRPMRAKDGNIYSVTRYGGPGNGGTIYRLRFGPTPMTQEAVILADGRVELHGILRPNGRDTDTAFEWGLDPMLKDSHTLQVNAVQASDLVKPVQALLSGLPHGTTHYYRVLGRNADNAMPQRGAILPFTIPTVYAEKPSDPVLTDASKGSSKNTAAQRSDSAQTARHKLKIIMVPGAGAGLVFGRQRGDMYEIGKSYTLTAKADNKYVFANWSGPGISGQTAENPQLTFTFTEELARHGFIHVTFLLNPFHESLLGPYHGLVLARQGVQPGISNTGALEVKVAELGDFTGLLRYDGDELPLAGTFDTGGSARFGDAQAFIALIPRTEKPSLLLSLQLDLSENGSGGIMGYVGLWNGEEAAWESQIHAMRSVTAATLASNAVIEHLIRTGSLEVEIMAIDSGEASPAKVLFQADGRLQLSATLSDGTPVLSEGHLSLPSQLSFFQSIQGTSNGSLGVEVPLMNLLRRPEEATTIQGWWLPPGQTMRAITLQAPTSSEAVGK